MGDLYRWPCQTLEIALPETEHYLLVLLELQCAIPTSMRQAPALGIIVTIKLAGIKRTGLLSQTGKVYVWTHIERWRRGEQNEEDGQPGNGCRSKRKTREA